MSIFTIVADGTCSENPGPGGWAFMIHLGETYVVGTNQLMSDAGGAQATTKKIMALTAIVEALNALRAAEIQNATINIRLDWHSILDGMFINMSIWKFQHWRKADGTPLPNADLWKEIDMLMHDLRGRGLKFFPIRTWGKSRDLASQEIDAKAIAQRNIQKSIADGTMEAPVRAATETPIVLDEPRSSGEAREDFEALLEREILPYIQAAPRHKTAPEPGSVLAAALDDTAAKQAALKAVLDDYAADLITLKGAYVRIKEIRI